MNDFHVYIDCNAIKDISACSRFLSDCGIRQPRYVYSDYLLHELWDGEWNIRENPGKFPAEKLEETLSNNAELLECLDREGAVRLVLPPFFSPERHPCVTTEYDCRGAQTCYQEIKTDIPLPQQLPRDVIEKSVKIRKGKASPGDLEKLNGAFEKYARDAIASSVAEAEADRAEDQAKGIESDPDIMREMRELLRAQEDEIDRLYEQNKHLKYDAPSVTKKMADKWNSTLGNVRKSENIEDAEAFLQEREYLPAEWKKTQPELYRSVLDYSLQKQEKSSAWMDSLHREAANAIKAAFLTRDEEAAKAYKIQVSTRQKPGDKRKFKGEKNTVYLVVHGENPLPSS